MKKEQIKLLQEIKLLIKENQMEKVKEKVNGLEDFQLATIISTLSNENQVVVFRLLQKENALSVFEFLNPSIQQELLSNFTDEKAIEIFRSLEPDDRIRLMDELPAAVAKRLMSSLTNGEKEMTLLLLGYEIGTAGHIMTPKYVRLRKDMSVSSALEKVRQSGTDYETIHHLYVTDATRKLEGIVSLEKLIISNPEKTICEIMEEQPIKVTTDFYEQDVAHLLKDADLVSVPVVDKEGRLVGVVTIDDAIDILQDEAKGEALNKAGLVEVSEKEENRSKVLINGSIFKVLRVRLPFLIITLIGGMLAGGIIGQFEDALETIAAIAFFVPVIMDMGGNVGTQSSTIFTRALVLGHIDFKKFLKHWMREIFVGLTIGVLIGIAGGFIATVWQQSVNFGFVVGVSLILTITIATSLGFIIPYILVKMGFDQAAGADPIITTIKDISGLMIYFVLVSWLLI